MFKSRASMVLLALIGKIFGSEQKIVGSIRS